MEKEEIINFFDKCADHWDEQMVRNDAIINTILDNADVTEGKDILDVACGTGVLFPDYIKRNVNSLTGIDISPKMAEIAKNKFDRNNIKVICGDVENMECDKPFDCIVVYNAFPHFTDPDRLIKKLSEMVKTGGTVTVAHGMSRKALDKHHSGSAHKVSNRLMSENNLAEIFSRYLKVSIKISDDNMYQVVGIKE
ncbi:MAG: class I SAM-dependent methyltransferase [Acetobacter sp.]|nr:class I SAM-dependent methyltransferase [Bacteroides sp.]MCM1341084.1 class I SAM-dependent methyltransferase [Acetobacter sp.]MCM1433583.1 class I SAM-dependent methyltransferase [Clostridiales bacterium]